MKDYIPSPEDIREQVLAFMREHNMSPAHGRDTWLILDGCIHRYQIEGRKNGKKDGAYCIFTDGIPAGFIQDWSTPNSKFTWSMKGGERSESSDFDINKWNEERAKRDAELKEQQKKASQAACDLFNNSQEENTLFSQKVEIYHSYLEKKGVKAYGVRLDNLTNRLMIPLKNIDGEFQSIQFIDSDGVKTFYYGAPTAGAFFSIGLNSLKTENDNTPILVGEGFATTAKIFQLTGFPCVAAMNCSNLERVIAALRGKFSSHPVIIMADNDIATFNKRGFNPGIDEAQKIVKKGLAIGYLAPEFDANNPEGSDWDDYALKFGDGAALAAIKAQMNKLFIEQKRQKYVDAVKSLGSMGGENFASFCTPVKGSNWLIQDWFPTESQMMLFAASGSGKGFAALDIAFSIACPDILEWHGFKIVKHGPVVYLVGEGQRGMRKRAAGLAGYKNIQKDKVELFFLPQALPLNDKNTSIGIQKAIANIGSMAPNPVLVILDTTNRYMAGDENSTEDATAYVNACAAIASEFPHTSVLTIHHTGQAAETRSRARGSSVFKAAMDMEYTIAKNDTLITLEMTKSKDTELQQPIMFRLYPVDAPGFFEDDGTQSTTCILKYEEEITRVNSIKSGQPEIRISKSEKFARDTYSQAAAEYGFIIKDIDGNEIAALSLENWRKVFYMKSAFETEASKRSQFHKARKLLLEEKQILFKDIVDGEECYFLKHDDSTFETDIISKIKGRR